MTRDEKLEALAGVLMTAASKARELSETGKKGDGYLSRETALSKQLEGIALEFKVLARERSGRTNEADL